MYETFEHTADLGLRVRAADLETLFAEAGRGFFSIIVANLGDVQPVQRLRLRVDGARRDDLLFDWLNELLYCFESQRLLLSHFEVALGESGLDAEVMGEPVDDSRHQLEHEVKAITYHGLTCERSESGWLAEVIVDI